MLLRTPQRILAAGVMGYFVSVLIDIFIAKEKRMLEKKNIFAIIQQVIPILL